MGFLERGNNFNSLFRSMLEGVSFDYEKSIYNVLEIRDALDMKLEDQIRKDIDEDIIIIMDRVAIMTCIYGKVYLVRLLQRLSGRLELSFTYPNNRFFNSFKKKIMLFREILNSPFRILRWLERCFNLVDIISRKVVSTKEVEGMDRRRGL